MGIFSDALSSGKVGEIIKDPKRASNVLQAENLLGYGLNSLQNIGDVRAQANQIPMSIFSGVKPITAQRTQFISPFQAELQAFKQGEKEKARQSSADLLKKGSKETTSLIDQLKSLLANVQSNKLKR